MYEIKAISDKLYIKVRYLAFYELLKPRLAYLVVFSSAFGYLLANKSNLNWVDFLLFCLGGFLISGSSLVVNQILEVKYDALMSRTQNRPLPTGKITKKEALSYSMILMSIGSILMLISSNSLAVLLSILTFSLYVFLYTPLKRVGPIAVFVGAIPGALPPLVGWVANTGTISYEALLLFGIQFIWQFPHFWAIAWVSDEDYKKAGFKLLPNGGKKDFKTAINIMTYTLFLLPLGVLPSYFGITGVTSAFVVTLCGVLFLAQTFRLIRDSSRKSALYIMFGSFIYLPIVQITFLIDKI